MFTLPALPIPDAPLLVACSGGLDSMVLLHRLLGADAFDPARVRAVHVHHGLNPRADDWAAHCRQQCAAFSVDLEVVRVQVDDVRGEGLEAAARRARYRAFASGLRAGDVLVTAHHRDDQAETFLLRALRASGPEGLGAMRQWRSFAEGWHWRPLLAQSREDLLAYAHGHGLAWIEDPANAALAHDRNFLRHAVMPLLRQRWPHAADALARSARLAADADALLEHEDARALAGVRGLDPRTVSVDALRALPAPRRARVLRRWLRELALPPLPAEGVRRIESELLPASPDREAEFAWAGARVRRWRDLLHAAWQEVRLAADWQADWQTAVPLVLPTGDMLELDSPRPWPTPLRVGARRGGERLRQPARGHAQALKKLLQAAGVPPWERQALPLLWDAGGELLAAGDLLYSGRFDAWLREHGARLHWRRTGATRRGGPGHAAG